MHSSGQASDRHPDWHPHVAECVMHSSRMLETMLGNPNFARVFIQESGPQLLLRLYTLKHMPVTFGSSAASHALLSAIRACTQSHAHLVVQHVVEALAEQLRVALLLGMVSRWASHRVLAVMLETLHLIRGSRSLFRSDFGCLVSIPACCYFVRWQKPASTCSHAVL
jgi:hypothetical protein